MNINFSKYTILIVDDNPTNLAVIVGYLEKMGFEIITARNGKMGLRRAKFAHPDVILLDIMMPEMDGFEACRRLKEDEKTKDIPVIFMSALTDTEDKVKGFNLGAVDYVTKPLQQEEVLARVTTHLQIRDLTKNLQNANQELTDLSEQLLQTNHELKMVNANKDKFFSIIAHDLRNPFLPLLGMSELLPIIAETASREEIKETGHVIHNSAQNVYNLLENLLAWARMQMKRTVFEPERFNLNEVVDNNIILLTENANGKEITLTSTLNSDVFVYADKNMIDAIIRNLISNALKFTPADGHVEIEVNPSLSPSEEEGTSPLTPNPSLLTPNSYIEVHVKDSGIGINPEDIDKFFHIDVHHTTMGTNEEAGTGLGLIMCKEMVERNGGNIWLESEVGKGTIVKFTLRSNSSPHP